MTAFLLAFLNLWIRPVSRFFNLSASPVFLTSFRCRHHWRNGRRLPNYVLPHTVACCSFWYSITFLITPDRILILHASLFVFFLPWQPSGLSLVRMKHILAGRIIINFAFAFSLIWQLLGTVMLPNNAAYPQSTDLLWGPHSLLFNAYRVHLPRR
jgi:hypothetical protein